jgi:hypothetical protein
MSCDQEQERNYVAEAYNWEQRVKGELESARVWVSNWGSIYASNEAIDSKSKIRKLEEEIRQLPESCVMSNYQLSHQNCEAYEKCQHRRMTGESIRDHCGLQGLEEEAQTNKGSIDTQILCYGKRRPAP